MELNDMLLLHELADTAKTKQSCGLLRVHISHFGKACLCFPCTTYDVYFKDEWWQLIVKSSCLRHCLLYRTTSRSALITCLCYFRNST